MNTKTKKGARNKGNPNFLRVPWNKGGLVNTYGPRSLKCQNFPPNARYSLKTYCPLGNDTANPQTI